jgi:hypothetical protein
MFDLKLENEKIVFVFTIRIGILNLVIHNKICIGLEKYYLGT